MVGDKNTPKTELSCKHGDTNMNRWPPNVLFAAYNDFMRQVSRGMLRRCGVNEVVHRLSCEEVFAAARRRDDKKYQILILDGALPNALEAIKEPGEGLWPELKIILIFSGPTREEVLNAINAGAHDILTYPFTEEVLEKRLHKLTSTVKTDTGEHVEERRLFRSDVPIMIVAPSLSDSPLVAEDVSSGGFKVVVSKRPLDNTIHELSIQTPGQIFEGCKAKVAWVRENETQPTTWSLGLSIHLLDDEQAQFSATLEEVLA